MSNQVLYRKYRPAQFADVIGQEHIVSVLLQAIKKKSLAHAYLFAGSRGTGKTSVARIFATELGCAPEDIYEIDAASHNGVEHIRELRETVRTLPYRSEYKVYIFDEAHMLSKAAWNAFLKTLEEPPVHVIFVLATTELDAVPETILSRCQVFRFNKPNEITLREMVVRASANEGYTLEDGVAELVALLGDGSFRDTYGVLEKIFVASTGKKITQEFVESVTHAPRAAHVMALLDACAKHDLSEALSVLETVRAGGYDALFFARLLSLRVRMILLARFAPALFASYAEALNPEESKVLKTYAGAEYKIFSAKFLSSIIDATLHIRDAFIPTVPIELALIEILGEK